jgi:hypothetical protein
MNMDSVATFTASDLKQSGPILDAAVRGVVRIRRRNEAFVLLTETQFDRILAEAADPRPKTLSDLVADYDAADVKARLSHWNAEPPQGQEAL